MIVGLGLIIGGVNYATAIGTRATLAAMPGNFHPLCQGVDDVSRASQR